MEQYEEFACHLAGSGGQEDGKETPIRSYLKVCSRDEQSTNFVRAEFQDAREVVLSRLELATQN